MEYMFIAASAILHNKNGSSRKQEQETNHVHIVLRNLLEGRLEQHPPYQMLNTGQSLATCTEETDCDASRLNISNN